MRRNRRGRSDKRGGAKGGGERRDRARREDRARIAESSSFRSGCASWSELGAFRAQEEEVVEWSSGGRPAGFLDALSHVVYCGLGVPWGAFAAACVALLPWRFLCAARDARIVHVAEVVANARHLPRAVVGSRSVAHFSAEHRKYKRKNQKCSFSQGQELREVVPQASGSCSSRYRRHGATRRAR